MKKYLYVLLILCVFITGCGENLIIDVDLTAMSSTMMIATIENIYASPDDYIDKIIKMRGQYYPYYYEETGNYYHYVMFFDEESCCSYGFEFIFGGGEYPDEEANIEVAGALGSYEELGQIWYYLTVDSSIILQ